MNPPTPPPPAQTGGGGVVVVGGGTSVPFHTHPSTAITGDLNDMMPERLSNQAREVTDCNSAEALETGWWSADNSAANTPDASFWVGQTIFYSIDTTTGWFAVQVAHEVSGTYRSFKRTLNVITWTAWSEVSFVP